MLEKYYGKKSVLRERIRVREMKQKTKIYRIIKNKLSLLKKKKR